MVSVNFRFPNLIEAFSCDNFQAPIPLISVEKLTDVFATSTIEILLDICEGRQFLDLLSLSGKVFRQNRINRQTRAKLKRVPRPMRIEVY